MAKNTEVAKTTAGRELPARVAAVAGGLTVREAIERWLARLTDNTRRAYARDLKSFASWISGDDVADDDAGEAIESALLSMCDVTPSAALLVLENWQTEMKRTLAPDGKPLSASTINRRVSAVNAALREMHKADIGPGRLAIRNIAPEAKKTILAPDVSTVARAIGNLDESDAPQAVRDLAIVLLAVQRGLRRSEIANLTVEDINLDDYQLAVQRKGKREKVLVDIAGATCEALERWMAIRNEHANDGEPGAFVALGNRYAGQSITDRGVYTVIRKTGADLGKRGQGWHPHALRHTAITETLARSNDSLAVAQEFAGHSHSQTTMRYVRDKQRLQQRGADAMADVLRLSERAQR
jgi:integrase